MKRSAPLRRTELRSKSLRPRRIKRTVHCAWSDRCKKFPSVKVSEAERYCKGHATDVADKLVGDYVKARDRRCVIADFNSLRCFGTDLSWCHLIPKGRYYATRWEPLNAVAGCRDHHRAFDGNPLAKRRWCLTHIGVQEYEEMEARAEVGGGPGAAEIIRAYRAEKE